MEKWKKIIRSGIFGRPIFNKEKEMSHSMNEKFGFVQSD